jgi:hypothetical protein
MMKGNYFIPLNPKLFYRQGKYLARILAEPRSLLIFKDDLYKKYFHGIETIIEDEVFNPKYFT